MFRPASPVEQPLARGPDHTPAGSVTGGRTHTDCPVKPGLHCSLAAHITFELQARLQSARSTETPSQ